MQHGGLSQKKAPYQRNNMLLWIHKKNENHYLRLDYFEQLLDDNSDTLITEQFDDGREMRCAQELRIQLVDCTERGGEALYKIKSSYILCLAKPRAV